MTSQRVRTSFLVNLGVAALIIVATASCAEQVNPPTFTLLTSQAAWLAREPVDYTYEYELSGVFNALSGTRFMVRVHQGEVIEVIATATGERYGYPGYLPTIDDLFQAAASADSSGSLTTLTFDPAWHFPTLIAWSGPPDASGRITAGSFRVVFPPPHFSVHR